MGRYRDVPMDFADATLASADSSVRIATFDSDFLACRRDAGSVGERLVARLRVTSFRCANASTGTWAKPA